jgi:uncharacterized protein YkwD
MFLNLLLMTSALTFADFSEMAHPLPGPKLPSNDAPSSTAPAMTAASAQASANELSPEDQKLLNPSVNWMMKAVNDLRAKAGLGTLGFDPACARAARAHAIDTAKNRLRGSVGSDGSLPQERYQRHSSDFSIVQENWGHIEDQSGTGAALTPKVMLNWWMNYQDPNSKKYSHRDNILAKDVTRLGISFYRAGTHLYVVQCFSAPKK